MYHRLRTVDLMISAEVAVRSRPQFSMVQTFLEYKRMRRGRHIVRETTDYVASPEISDNRIIPDGAFILENIETGKRGFSSWKWTWPTMRIASDITRDSKVTLLYKIRQYDLYLQSLHPVGTGIWGIPGYFNGSGSSGRGRISRRARAERGPQLSERGPAPPMARSPAA